MEGNDLRICAVQLTKGSVVAGFRFKQLAEEFIKSLERDNATVIRSISSVRPAQFRVITQERTTECLLFLWTITPGGGGSAVRPANERRIQITNVSRLPLQPGVRTLLGGWSDEHQVFAFWDARRHTRFSQKSPSLQVDSNTLETAFDVGIATQLRPTKEGREVVVAVNRASLLWYVQSGLPLHNAVDDESSVVSLAEHSDEEREFLDSSTTEDQAARRFDLVQTMRAFRDARFRPMVLQAYRYRCAVCMCDLKLVDAAHIVPVAHPSSTDEVTNGLALCRLHHGAYDIGLLGIRSDYTTVINDEVAKRLDEIGLANSLEEFRSKMSPQIHFPTSIEARPLPRNLIVGLEARRWPSSLIA